MGAIVGAFDLFHKRLATGSANIYGTGGPGSRITAGYLTKFWYTESVMTGTARISHSYLNFPEDGADYQYASTRNSSSMIGYRALPWSSHACDFLWNCTVPSWSYSMSRHTYTTQSISYVRSQSTWTMRLDSSQSFHKLARNSSYGVSSYNVTSSWHIVDPNKGKNSGASSTYPTGAKFFYATFDSRVSSTQDNCFPTFIGSSPVTPTYPGGVAPLGSEIDPIDLTNGNWIDLSSYYAFDVTYPNTTNLGATGSYDSIYFDRSGAVGITKRQVSQSYVDYDDNYAKVGMTDAQYDACTIALKKRRLFFPTQVSASGTANSQDYWFKQFTGYQSSELFLEKGGIYNLQFTLKKSGRALELKDQYTPDTGSYMKVFIHNVTTLLTGSNLGVAGEPGWYPPDNNIIIVGNAYSGLPTMDFYDSTTGYIYERFNINLIQYASPPVQLCFEACGDANTDSYFGVMVDDVSICKIGVTTDPRYIQLTSVATGVNTRRAGGTIPEA